MGMLGNESLEAGEMSWLPLALTDFGKRIVKMTEEALSAYWLETHGRPAEEGDSLPLPAGKPRD
jgi:hypothetical protein